MTVVVAFACSDGVVVAADSMITPSVGTISVGHHHGKKVEIISGPQVFAFAGDQGQGARFKFIADAASGSLHMAMHPINYAVSLSTQTIQQFTSTGINNSINLATILAFVHKNAVYCCVYEGVIQPRLLDVNHYYVALGSGKLSADPFLRFLVDIFCPNGPPTVREAVFLATWAIQHVIETNPGGVAGPIRITTLQMNAANIGHARELPDTEIDEHKQAIGSAEAALRKWRGEMQVAPAGAPVPSPPQAPPAAPPAAPPL